MADYDSGLPIRGMMYDGGTPVPATDGIFIIGASDGSNYQTLSCDSSGVLNVNASFSWSDTNQIHIWDGTTALGVATDGSAEVTTGIVAMGSDGTNNYTLLTDNAGQLIVDTGLTMFSWADTNQVHIWDGTTALAVAVDGSTAKTNGIQILGTDGTNAQILSTDTNGVLNVNVGGGRANTVTYNSANCVKATPATIVSQAGAKEVVKVQASGSGRMKVEVKYGTTASEAVIAVLFNSTANPNVEYVFPDGLAVAAGQTILLSVTNLENAASPASDFTGYGSIVSVA